MAIKPVGFRVLVKPDPIEEKTQSGIVLAVDEKLEKGARITGVVVGIGPDAFKAFKASEPWFKVGDRVYYAKYAGKGITDRTTKEEYVVLNDEDIVAIDE